MSRGILAKDTHGSTIRIAPPLVVTEAEVGLLVDAVADGPARPVAGRAAGLRRVGAQRVPAPAASP